MTVQWFDHGMFPLFQNVACYVVLRFLFIYSSIHIYKGQMLLQWHHLYRYICIQLFIYTVVYSFTQMSAFTQQSSTLWLLILIFRNMIVCYLTLLITTREISFEIFYLDGKKKLHCCLMMFKSVSIMFGFSNRPIDKETAICCHDSSVCETDFFQVWISRLKSLTSWVRGSRCE